MSHTDAVEARFDGACLLDKAGGSDGGGVPPILLRRHRGLGKSYGTRELPADGGGDGVARCGCCLRALLVVDGIFVFPCACRDQEKCVLCHRCPDDCCELGAGPAAERRRRKGEL